jgi:hypothetical protein
VRACTGRRRARAGTRSRRPLTVATTLATTPQTEETPQQWLEVSVGEAAEGVFDAVPSFAVTGDGFEQREAPVHEIAAAELDPLTESASGQYEELFLQVPPASPTSQPRLPNTTTREQRHRRGGTRTHDLDLRPSGRVRIARASASGLRGVHRERISQSPVRRTSAADRGVAENQPMGYRVGHARGLAWATALYLRGGAPPLARVEDRLDPLTADAVDNWRFEELVTEFNNGRSKGWELGSHGEMTWQVPSVGQVSCWSFTDDQGSGLMMRLRLQTATRSHLQDHSAARARGV